MKNGQKKDKKPQNEKIIDIFCRIIIKNGEKKKREKDKKPQNEKIIDILLLLFCCVVI